MKMISLPSLSSLQHTITSAARSHPILTGICVLIFLVVALDTYDWLKHKKRSKGGKAGPRRRAYLKPVEHWYVVTPGLTTRGAVKLNPEESRRLAAQYVAQYQAAKVE